MIIPKTQEWQFRSEQYESTEMMHAEAIQSRECSMNTTYLNLGNVNSAELTFSPCSDVPIM